MAKWQFDKRIVGSTKVIAFVAVIAIILYFTPALILQITSAQRWAGRELSTALSSELGTPVKVGRVSFEGWHSIHATDISIQDQGGRPLLSTHTLEGGVDLWRLISGKGITLTSARLFDLEVYLIEDSTGRLNAQHIIDHLIDNDKDDSSSSLSLDINIFLLRRAHISYQRHGASPIEIHDLDLQVSRFTTSPYLAGLIDQLSFRTSGGLRLSDLEASVSLRSDTLEVAHLKASMPGSVVSAPLLRLDMGRKGLQILQDIQVDKLSIGIDDIVPLYPPLAALSGKKLELTHHGLRVSPRELSANDMTIRLSNDLAFKTNATIRLDSMGSGALYKLDQVELFTSDELTKTLPQIFSLPTAAADILSRLGDIRHTGHWAWTPQETLHAQGMIESELGSLDLKLTAQLDKPDNEISIDSHVSTDRLDLSPILGHPTTIVGEIEAQIGLTTHTALPYGTAMLNIHQLSIGTETYNQIRTTIKGDNKGLYAMSLLSSDPKLTADITAGFAIRDKEIRQIALDVHKAEAQIGALTGGKVSKISTELSLNVSHLDLDRALGDIDISRLQICNSDSEVDLRHIQLSARDEDGIKMLKLTTPWMQASMSGSYQLRQLVSNVSKTLQKRVPILRHMAAAGRPSSRWSKTNVKLVAQIDSIPIPLLDMLELPIQEVREIQLSSHYQEDEELLDLHLTGTRASLLGHSFDLIDLHLQDNQLRLGSHVHIKGGGEFLGAALLVTQDGDNFSLDLDLGEDKSGVENGRLGLSAKLGSFRDKVNALKDLTAEVKIAPSKIRVHTTDWDIASATIMLGDNLIRIHGLSLIAPERSIRAEGELGRMGLGVMDIDLQQINLRYILEAVGVDFSLLETDLSGHIQAQLKGDKLTAQAQVSSPQILVSGHDVGRLDAALSFDSEDLYIRLSGDVHQPHGGKSKVNGWIKPADGAGIDLNFDATKLDVSFVGSFMDNIFSQLSGYASGEMRLHGLFADGVTVSGLADITSGQASIGILGTTYYFDHRLTLSDERIDFDQMQIRDADGNFGYLNGFIHHKYFDDFKINLRGSNIEKMKVLQTTSPRYMPVYGTAYASGSAEMHSIGDRTQIKLELRSESGTDVTLDFLPTSAGRDNQLLHFTRLRPDSLLRDSVLENIEDNATIYTGGAIDLELQLAITPEAKLGMKLAADMSSELKGRGEGILNINAPSQGQAEVYGSLSVLGGTFAFRLEQLAQKQFSLREGGQVTFRGDPTTAGINLSAVYNLTANIADLDEDLSIMAGRTNIPVSCILALSGNISRPDIRFGIELPGVDSDIERRVRSLLNSQDAITRQMLYLIALGKFYTETQSNSTTNNWTAVASSALSEQLSSLLGSFSNTIKLGTSIKTRNTAFEDTDIELLFSGSLFDNRLTINGNIGYHDTPYLNGEYLGEFDFEYKLNRSGSVRLKGYNRYNNMYQYLRQSLMTQGFGILFRQRFDRLSDLWRGPRSSQRQERAKGNKAGAPSDSIATKPTNQVLIPSSTSTR